MPQPSPGAFFTIGDVNSIAKIRAVSELHRALFGLDFLRGIECFSLHGFLGRVRVVLPIR